jgi:hypothetical protein
MKSDPSVETFMFWAHPRPSCDSVSEGTVQNLDEVIFPVDCRVFHVCVRNFSHVYSHVCKKAVCSDENLVHKVHIMDLITLRNDPLSPDKSCYLVIFLVKVLRTQVHRSSLNSVQNHFHHCKLTFWTLFGKFLSLVIVPHEFICMIHGLVVTTYLEDEFVSVLFILKNRSIDEAIEKGNPYVLVYYESIKR